MACRSASRLRIAACTDTSSADVGSSQTTMRGPPPNARAMATRCFRPPDSCRGRSDRCLGSIRTDRIRSVSRSVSAEPDRPASLTSGLQISWRTVCLRFSAESGFWKTICSALSCAGLRRLRSAPSGWPSSSIDRPGVGRDQPEQDSRERCLTAAGLPDQAERLAAFDVQVHPGQRMHRLAARAKVFDRFRMVTTGSAALGVAGSCTSSGVLLGRSPVASCR